MTYYKGLIEKYKKINKFIYYFNYYDDNTNVYFSFERSNIK